MIAPSFPRISMHENFGAVVVAAKKTIWGEVFFKAINRVMEATGHIMHGGTIIDATIISAPSSTKNAEKKRDPKIRCTLQSRTCF